MTHMHFTPDAHRKRAGLPPEEFEQLCEQAIGEWFLGGAMPSLVHIREHGSEKDYETAVSRICAFDDRQKDREVERQVHRLRAQRAD
jgi:hypothetical protein